MPRFARQPWRFFAPVVLAGILGGVLGACSDEGLPRAPLPGSGHGGNGAVTDGPITVVDAPVDSPSTDARADSLDAGDAGDAGDARDAGLCLLQDLVCPTGSYCCVDTCLPFGAACNF